MSCNNNQECSKTKVCCFSNCSKCENYSRDMWYTDENGVYGIDYDVPGCDEQD